MNTSANGVECPEPLGRYRLDWRRGKGWGAVALSAEGRLTIEAQFTTGIKMYGRFERSSHKHTQTLSCARGGSSRSQKPQQYCVEGPHIWREFTPSFRL